MGTGNTMDINADVGEGWDDQAVAPFVNSINIACGGHTGDESTMLAAIDLAARFKLRAGAHPSFPDRGGFGRDPMTMDGEAFLESMSTQIDQLATLARSTNMPLTHVKPHGALYHSLYSDLALARLFTRVVPAGLVVVTMPGGVLAKACDEAGIPVWFEGYADRAYTSQGKLAPRNLPGSLITDPDAAARQARALAAGTPITTLDGNLVRLSGLRTVCLHSDTPNAAAIAKAIQDALRKL